MSLVGEQTGFRLVGRAKGLPNYLSIQLKAFKSIQSYNDMIPLARHRSADRHSLMNPTYKPFYIGRHFRYQKAFFCRFPIFRQGGAWSVDKVKAGKRKFFQNSLENKGIQFFSWSKNVNRPHPASFPLIGQRKRSKRNSLKV